jgi:hypothetical protein
MHDDICKRITAGCKVPAQLKFILTSGSKRAFDILADEGRTRKSLTVCLITTGELFIVSFIHENPAYNPEASERRQQDALY